MYLFFDPIFDMYLRYIHVLTFLQVFKNKIKQTIIGNFKNNENERKINDISN